MPLKRVNQAYVIATSTHVQIKGVDISKFDDSYFKAAEKPREKKGEDEFFKTADTEEKKVRHTPPCKANRGLVYDGSLWSRFQQA